MMINDAVHGRVEISDKAMVELIRSRAFQRLRGICQQGVPVGYILKSQPAFLRYDHCVGTMLILRKLDASREEQIAGLLHDVSHTAFSHMIDYVIGTNDKEDYQDSIHHTFFGNGTELAGILRKHRMDPGEISDLERFGLLEREQPELCADRFDYTTRYWAVDGDRKFVELCLGAVTVMGNTMVFKSRKAAREFATRHMVWQPEWAGWGATQFDMRIRWYLFSEALKTALDEGIIKQQDFMATDSHVMKKMIKARNQRIIEILNLLRRPIRFRVANSRPKLVLYSKFRYVDPLFIEDGRAVRLSRVDKAFRADIAAHRRLNRRGIRLESIQGIQINNVQP